MNIDLTYGGRAPESHPVRSSKARAAALFAALGLGSIALAGQQDFPAGEPEAGAAVRALVAEPGVDAMPAWTPDGRRVLFHARRTREPRDKLPTRKIWIVDRDGRNARELSQGAGDEYHPVPSPDGRKIAFVSESSGNRDVWVADAGGLNPIPLTDDPALEEHPTWSPDGRRIAYVALPKEGGNFDLWLMNADGSGKKKLTFSAANELFPAWHPTRDWIAFVTDVDGNYDLHAFGLEDEKTFPLVTSRDHETRPAWSPDGSKLAFARWPASGESDAAEIVVANADGSGALELELPRGSTHPAWSPDGGMLAFQRATDKGWDLFVAALPEDVTRSGRLHLARSLRGDKERDLVRLRDGGRVSGRIPLTAIRIRTSYALLALPRQAVASIEFAALEQGTARVVLGNGDAVSGILVEDAIVVESAAGNRTIAKEKIESVGLSPPTRDPAIGPIRLVMKNGDAFTGNLATQGLRVRVGSQSIAVPVAELARATFGDGERATLVTRKGDTLAGALETTALRITLAAGPVVDVSPSYVRTLVNGAER